MDKSLLFHLLDKVPNYREFLLVKEIYESNRKLEKKHRDIMERVEIGSSRAKLPIEALIIHGGEDKRVLAYAFPHPNEPIGSLTLDSLTRILASNRDLLKKSSATWIIVKVADVYGAILNEGWFKGTFTVRKYLRNYYRPPPYKQVEWTFPIKYKTLRWDKPLPETKALMKLIKEWKPTHIYSLHNSFFSGTYYYLSKKPSKDVLDLLTTIPKDLGIPIHKGQPEAPYLKQYATGVFSMISIKDDYDWYAEHSNKDPAEILKVGGNSYDYAKSLGIDVFEVICEVPYIYDLRLDDNTRIGLPKREIYRIIFDKSQKNIKKFQKIAEKAEKYVSTDNPYFEPVKQFLNFVEKRIEAEREWLESDKKLEELATAAEVVHSYTLMLWEIMSLYGRTLKALSIEEEKGIKIPRTLKEKGEEEFKKHLNEFEKSAEYKVVPIKNVVKIQLASILSTTFMDYPLGKTTE